MDHGHPPLRGAVPLARLHAGALVRELRHLLRHPLPVRGAQGRTAAAPLPTYPRLVELDCAFGEKAGWERPNWFESNAADGDEALRPRGWAGRHWSPAIGAEALATRQAAALFDETSFSKIEISGPGALAFLERLCDNRMDRPVGRITYTQMLNRRGGIECDFTVTRLAEDRFWIVTGTAFGNHDLGWIRRHAPDDGSVEVADLTSTRACLGIWGPAAREIVGSLTDDDLSNDAFPYMTARQISVGGLPVLALRVTYVGELGWELYCPTEDGLALWDALWEAGRPHGMRAGGYRAIDSLRLEKGYRVWSTDITPEDTPYQAGLGFAVRMDKPAASSAARRWRQPATRWSGGCAAWCWTTRWRWPLATSRSGSAARWSGGSPPAATATRSPAASPTATCRSGCTEIGQRAEVEVFGEWVGAEVAAEPLYDREGARVRS